MDEKKQKGVLPPISRAEMLTYYTESIIYRLGDEERHGLQVFFDLALLHGLTKHRTVVEVVEN